MIPIIDFLVRKNFKVFSENALKQIKKIFNVILCLFHSMDLVYYQMKTRSKI